MDINQIIKKHKIDAAAILDLSKRLIPITIEKGECFINYGERMNKIGILIDGILVSRYSTSEGDEITSKFYYPKGDTIVVDYHSFKNQLSSNEVIQAVENCHLMVIKYDDFNYLLNTYPSIKELVLKFSEESYLKALERIRDFQTLKPEQRITKFIDIHSHIASKLMVKDKASYLGMHRNVFAKHSI